MQGTPGWELVPEVAEVLGDAQIVNKPTFGSVALARQIAMLAEQEPIAVELVGLCTDICVVSNALLLKGNGSGGSHCSGPGLLRRCDGGTPSNGVGDMESCQIMVGSL